MNAVFADTLYWMARVYPRDPWKAAAREARRRAGKVRLVTTDDVLTELLAGFSQSGPFLRNRASAMVRELLRSPDAQVVLQSRDSFLRALLRYERRSDKSYSLTDCVSMNVKDELGIRAVLTNDHHFEQEGYVVLMRRDR